MNYLPMIFRRKKSIMNNDGRTRRTPALAIVAAVYVAMGALTGLTSQATASDATLLGHTLVKAKCSGCHATENAGDSPLAAAPKFRDLHLLYDVELLDEALVEGISTGHPGMPQFQFAPLQADAIIAYVKSLEK